MIRPEVIRLGVVGLGVISGYYLRAIDELAEFELVAVCDLDDAVLSGHRVRTHQNHREMLVDGGLDAVVVTAPNDAHVVVCRDVLDAGLAVCVEKPLATTLADGVELVSAARARDVALFTAFHRRYNSNVLALRDQLVGAAPIESLTVRYLENIEEHLGGHRWYLDPSRCGGGCVADNGPNALDLARLFLGPLRLIDARVVRDEAGVDRQALLTAGRDARPLVDVRATIELDWSFPGETKDVEVRLTDGTMLRADMLDGYPEFKESLRHEYVGVLRDFAVAVRTRGGWQDGGLAALSIVDEAYRRENSVDA